MYTSYVEAYKLSRVSGILIANKNTKVFIIFIGIFLIVTLLVYPATWSNPEVETVCGKEVSDLSFEYF